MLQPENQSKKYQQLFTGIDIGQIKIPRFQRDFVWSKEQTARLIDSIIKGFPIGTFIFWKTGEELQRVKDIGNIALPDPPKGDVVLYVLDGQQRITSLYAVQKGLLISKDGQTMDYKDIFIDLSRDPDEDDEVVTVERPPHTASISVHKLLNAGLVELVREYPQEDLLGKIGAYRERLTGYDFSTILISDYPIDVACEIFTRINTGGTELKLFEIMVARTYDQERDFDLAREYEWLVNNKGAEKDLEDVCFDTVPNSTVLQCIAAHICQQVRRKDILRLNKFEVIDSWPTVKGGIFTAVDYARTHLRIPASRLLPYDALLVPLSYFFIRNNGNMPSPRQHKLLTQYFWWASLSERFNSGVEAKIGLDLRRMDAIQAERRPDYRGEELSLTLDDLRWHWFSTGNAFCKAILCLYAYFQPRSFETDHLVILNNAYLRQANSKNYHHFFPRSYLQKAYFSNRDRDRNRKANSILNITVVDEQFHKREIGAKPPSQYMRKFMESNHDLSGTMKTHLIDDLDAYGIWDDDYEAFIEHRGQRVLEELTKRLVPDL